MNYAIEETKNIERYVIYFIVLCMKLNVRGGT